METRITRSLIRSALALGVAVFISPPASAQLSQFGPLNQHGYPDRYVDFNGLALEQAVDPTDPFQLSDLAELPDRFAPLDVATGNFWDETFYWVVETTMPTSGGTALLVMATEAIFMNNQEAVIDGTQGVMGRLRIRIDVSKSFLSVGKYRVITPYGVDDFTLSQADLGIRAINFTVDSISGCGMCPNNRFDTPLMEGATRIGPTWLTWENYLTEAPAGHIGDPMVPHRVTGSPFGTNFFRIEGPNIGGLGVHFIETDLFAVMGKIAPAAFQDCNGNGVLDAVDIESGFSSDCDLNALPDECDISNGDQDDRNENGIPDKCEIRDRTISVFSPFTPPQAATAPNDPPGGRLLNIIKNFGPCPRRGACPDDIAPPGGDGVVDMQDLIAALGAAR